ncbi:MAG TPA: transposase [bacterium]|nr:transposase [bacterium]HOX85614.1 transposase [bacterium]HPG44773.1 transposase [bacterium]
MVGYTTLWLHMIWQVHGRQRVFETVTIQQMLSRLLYCIFRNRSMTLRMNAVRPEHIHLLILQPSSQALDGLVQTLQRDVLQQLQTLEMPLPRFTWSEVYAAFSVSRSQLDELVRYFSEQKRLHHTFSCAEEWQMLQNMHRT